MRAVSSRERVGWWRRSRALHHMLSPSLRLLVRHQAPSASLQLRRHLNSTHFISNRSADFKGWVREVQRARRGKQPLSPSRSAWVGEPLEKKKKKITGQKSPRHSHKKPFNAMSREQRILETVNTIRDKRRRTTSTDGGSRWPAENWSTDSWGLDSAWRVLNSGTIERADHNEPEQNSNLDAHIEVPPPRPRDLRVWS